MNMSFAACTIVAHNYLPQARILAESFKKFHPESTFYIVIIDRPIEARLVRSDFFQVIPITDIDHMIVFSILTQISKYLHR